jgi:FlaA1/EpsC-like NDP-sugar epimerase
VFQGVLYSWQFLLSNKIPVIIYGAGSAGVQLEESLRKSIEYSPVAFIDDDPSKHGTIINYTRVHAFNELRGLIKIKKAKVILLGISSLSEIKKKEILKKLSKFPIEVKVIPSPADIVTGQVTIESIKHVDVRDILGRLAVEPKKSLLKKNIYDKNILITGAGGSIGSELCRQIQLLSPNKIILFDHSEFNLYTIHQELSKSKKKAEVISILASVTDAKCMEKVIHENKIHTIYHAAAYKHVPMVEMNVVEGVGNNILGTYQTAKAAIKYKVENFILISTDKAVRPTNVMGATKRFAEIILQGFNKRNSNTCFSMVRFGNVLDSAGSVVPLFRKQIKGGGPLTVTHKDITRYFMSIPEAVQLVLQAGAMAKGGDVFVLDMGEPIKIIDLAYKMIHLSGMTPVDKDNPEGDIKIKVTGLRPGEKLYEELLIGDNVMESSHPRIMQAKEKELAWNDIQFALKLFEQAHCEKDEILAIELLDKYVDGYTPEEKEKKLYKELSLN